MNRNKLKKMILDVLKFRKNKINKVVNYFLLKEIKNL